MLSKPKTCQTTFDKYTPIGYILAKRRYYYNEETLLDLVAGALSGSFVYALVYDSLRPTLIDSFDFGGVTLVDWFGGNALLVGYVFALALLGAVLWLDHQDRVAGAADEEACALPQTPQTRSATSKAPAPSSV